MVPRTKILKWALVAAALALPLLLIGGVALARDAGARAYPDDFSPAAGQQSSAHFDLSWNVVASGGGTIGSAHYEVAGTIGQPTAGEKSSAHYESCTGFWCALGSFLRELFVPATYKGYSP